MQEHEYKRSNLANIETLPPCAGYRTIGFQFDKVAQEQPILIHDT